MKYFGTDGIRGEANVGPMGPDLILRAGQAFGVLLRESFEKPRVLVGKDTRISCYMIENILAAGLMSVGVDVLFVGPLPTPGVAYLTRGMRASAGVMISASHNPYHDNGIKFFTCDGFKLPDAQEERIEQLMDDAELSKHLVDSAHLGRAKRIDDALGQYAVFLKERFPKSLKLDGKRIVLDCANGAGYKVAPKVFEELGADVMCLHAEPNGMNINLESGALHPETLQAEVLRFRADIGIALDGDGDRLVVVDEKGEVLDGDQILCLCANELKTQNQLDGNAIVVTVMSNKGIDVAMQKIGVDVVRTPVGDRHVFEELRRRQLILGGEQSGHLIFLDSNTTGDGIIAALKILEIMLKRNKKVSELAEIMQKLPQVTRSVKVSRKPSIDLLPKFNSKLKEVESALGISGRVLFRYSGTEPKARITLEGPDLTQIKEMAGELEKLLVEEIESTR